jgi:hypothetical protein
MADADVVSGDRVKQEALVGDEADDVEETEEAEGIKSTDGEDDEDEDYKDVSGSENVSSICEEEEEDGSGSEEEDSDDRPSKRYVSVFNCHVVSNVYL